MNRRRTGLGSGLDALLPSEPKQSSAREVAVGRIRQNPRQPRTIFEDSALADLAASIREHGIIQPLIVSDHGEGQYELIAGERRLRAAQLAGVERVPVIIRETTPQQLLELALIENVQRADLNALEEARAYQSLKDEFGLSDDQIAQRIGINSRETVANTRRLLKLIPEAQEAVLRKQITAGHGRALLAIENTEHQEQALAAMIESDMNVRDAERFSKLVYSHGEVKSAIAALQNERNGPASAKRVRQNADKRVQPATALSADDEEIRRQIERTLGTPVKLARSNSELRVTIEFYSDEKLQEFFDLLNTT